MNTIEERLLAPYPPEKIGWKPQSAKGDKALAVAYIDARDVMDRLDAVVGVAGWKDTYEVLGNDAVKCTLSVRIDGEWVSKEDVGGQSDQPDEGDKTKAAFSDALKRAAVKFGIGRFLYDMPLQWCPYDPVKKRFIETPKVPARFYKQAPAAPAEVVARPPETPTTHRDLHLLMGQYAQQLGKDVTDVVEACVPKINPHAKSVDDLNLSEVKVAAERIRAKLKEVAA